VALLVAALAQPVVDLLYAPHLQASGPLLRWLIFGAVLMTLDQMLSSTMIAAHAQKEDLRTLVIAVVALLLFLLVGISQLGVLGAALAVPAALFVRVLWRLRWLMREHRVPGLPSQLWRTALAALGARGVLELTMPWGPWASTPATLATYIALLVVLGILGRRHLELLKPWLGRLPLRFLS